MEDPLSLAEVSDEDFKHFEGKAQTEPTYSDSLIQAYIAFRDKVFNPNSVLHPSCAFDASPAKAFDDVTFVDLNKDAMRVLREHGHNAIAQDIRKYNPKKKHDLLILLNPAIDTEWASQHIIPGGYILSNDYHGNASHMNGHPRRFQFLGALDWADDRRGASSPTIYTDTSGFFEPVKSLDELKSLSPERYHTAKKMAEFILQSAGKSLSGDSDKDYLAYCELLHANPDLPDKRTADMYIFRKR